MIDVTHALVHTYAGKHTYTQAHKTKRQTITATQQQQKHIDTQTFA